MSCDFIRWESIKRNEAHQKFIIHERFLWLTFWWWWLITSTPSSSSWSNSSSRWSAKGPTIWIDTLTRQFLFSIWIWKWFSKKKWCKFSCCFTLLKSWIALNQLEMIATLKIFKNQTFYSKIIWKMSKIKTCGKSTYHLQ